MTFRFLPCLLLFAGIISGPSQAATEKYRAASETLMKEGRFAMAEEDYFEALNYFERALVADPGNVNALVAIGRAHGAMDQTGASLDYYRRALAIEPNDKEALKAQALAYLKTDEVAQAEENAARLKRICGEADCAQLQTVSQAIAEHKAQGGAGEAGPDGGTD